MLSEREYKMSTGPDRTVKKKRHAPQSVIGVAGIDDFYRIMAQGCRSRRAQASRCRQGTMSLPSTTGCVRPCRRAHSGVMLAWVA